MVSRCVWLSNAPTVTSAQSTSWAPNRHPHLSLRLSLNHKLNLSRSLIGRSLGLCHHDEAPF